MAFNSLTETAILEDDFQSYPLVSTSCNLVLTEKALFVGVHSKGKTETEKIYLSDVIGSHAFREKHSKTKNETELVSAYFCVYAYPLKTTGGILNKQTRRDKKTLTFLTSRYATQDENFSLVEKWQRAINCLSKGISCLQKGGLFNLNVPKKTC